MNTTNTTTNISQTTQSEQLTNTANPDSLLLNMVNTDSTSIDTTNTTGTTNTNTSSDSFQDMRDYYSNNIDSSSIQQTLFQNGKKFEGSHGEFYKNQGSYMKALSPIFGNLMDAIKNNDQQGVYNALYQALQLAGDLKTKRANDTGHNDLVMKAGAEKNVYQNILNDPNMINLQNPQHTMEFFTQTMMWTNGGSLPDYMYNASQNVGATTIFMDPLQSFPQYNY